MKPTSSNRYPNNMEFIIEPIHTSICCEILISVPIFSFNLEIKIITSSRIFKIHGYKKLPTLSRDIENDAEAWEEGETTPWAQPYLLRRGHRSPASQGHEGAYLFTLLPISKDRRDRAGSGSRLTPGRAWTRGLDTGAF